MTTKTTSSAPREKRRPEEPSPEAVRAAYEIHTLTHLMYRELAATRPWLIPPPPVAPPWPRRTTWVP